MEGNIANEGLVGYTMLESDPTLISIRVIRVCHTKGNIREISISLSVSG